MVTDLFLFFCFGFNKTIKLEKKKTQTEQSVETTDHSEASDICAHILRTTKHTVVYE